LEVEEIHADQKNKLNMMKEKVSEMIKKVKEGAKATEAALIQERDTLQD